MKKEPQILGYDKSMTYRDSFAWIFAVLVALVLPVHSQTAYPNKPIRYIIPVAAGGGSDTVGRVVIELAKEKNIHLD